MNISDASPFDVNMKISNLKDKVISSVLVGIIVAIMYTFNVPCFFKSLFHIQCPGCGMTRAYIALLHLNIKQAFLMNPMFWSIPILFALFLFDGKIFKAKWANTLLPIPIYIGFFALFVFRLITS